MKCKDSGGGREGTLPAQYVPLKTQRKEGERAGMLQNIPIVLANRKWCHSGPAGGQEPLLRTNIPTIPLISGLFQWCVNGTDTNGEAGMK